MGKKLSDPNLLRAEAEAQLHLYKMPAAKSQVRPSDELLHELRVHQIELEMQNDELRCAYAALEESHDRYLDLYDFAPVGYLTLTGDGKIAEINLTAAGMLGVDRKDLLQRRFTAFITPKDGDWWHIFFSGVKRSGEWQSTELTLKRFDGSEFPVLLDCLPAMSGDKDLMLRITLTDITELKQTKEALHEAETHTLAIALASAEMGTWDWDITTGHVIFNEQWAKLRGYRLEDIEPHFDTGENGIYPDDFPAYHEALTAHLENRTPFFQAEYRVRTLRGPLIWVLNRGTVIKRDAEGNPLRMAGIEMDITERKRNDEQQRIAALAFETQEGVIVTDANAVIIRVNQAFTRLTGYSAEEVLGQTPHLLSSGRHDNLFYQSMWNALNDNGFWQGDIWNRRKNGMIFAERLSITALSAPDGSIAHYVASFSEIVTTPSDDE